MIVDIMIGVNNTKMDTNKSMYGVRLGQKVRIVGRNCKAVVAGVGWYPNEFGLKKLVLKEEDGRYSIVDCKSNFAVL